MLQPLPLILVVLAGLYLIVLAGAAVFAPARARRFLMGFAQTARAHFWELGFRSLAGAAFVLQAPHMRFPNLFAAFGWVLLVSTLALFVMPWRWHHAFAERALPKFTQHLLPIGLVALVLGTIICYAALAP